MESEIVELVLSEAREKMKKAVAHTRAEFSGVRTGRASSSIVERVVVDYHGAEVPLQQLASFSVPDAQQLVISPYDKNSIESIRKAIQSADLGLNPSADGSIVRRVFPPLTEERRKELVRLVRSMAESGRVSIRNARRSARYELESLGKDGDLSEDEVHRGTKHMDDLTHEMEEGISEALLSKEQELMQV